MNQEDLAQQAINAALSSAWQKAIKLNLKIIKKDKNNLQALNRLAQAYWKTSNKKKSLLTYKRVLKIDKYNQIALKNLAKIKLQRGKIKNVKISNHLLQTIFLEEPGKTKIINLVKLAHKQTLSSLSCADNVLIKPKKRTVIVSTFGNKYIGALPDDISLKLIFLIKGGNQYEAFIKSVEENSVSVFLREIKKGKKFKNLPSFTSSGQTSILS